MKNFTKFVWFYVKINTSKIKKKSTGAPILSLRKRAMTAQKFGTLKCVFGTDSTETLEPIQRINYTLTCTESMLLTFSTMCVKDFDLQ